MRTKTKEKSLGALIKKVDEQVSLYVRLTAADQFGAITCISCGQRVFWKDAHCCHFKDRYNMATRFFLPNLAAGCVDCNVYNHYEHITMWQNKLSPAILNMLDERSHSLYKFTRPELEDLLNEFTEKVAQRRKQKGL